MRIMALALIVGLGSPGGASETGPSFDCTKASSSAEEAICADSGLAALDQEISRLYGLARDSQSGEALDTLKAYQRGWIKGRDDCWKASIALESCVAAVQVIRIHELRRDYAATRGTLGASTGPFSYQCDTLDDAVSTVFINTSEISYASLSWSDYLIILPQVRAASGAKYADADGNMFWSKGNEALVTLDGADHQCAQVNSG